MSGGNSSSSKKENDKNSNHVKVVVRCRPMNSEEKKQQCASVIQCESSRKEVSVQIDNEKIAAYYFDRVFDHTASQEFVYRSVVADCVEDAIQGCNCTVFAYGQTGTGKTYTMEGYRTESKESDSPFWYGDQAGMIPRAAQHIFQRMTSCTTKYKITVSYTELYNHEIIDLLADGNSQKSLSIRSNEGNKGCVISGLKHVRVQTPEDIFKIIEIASHKRNVAETLLNERSSRSHCIFTVTIYTKEITKTGEEITKIGKLNLVDLAGSENTKRSGVEDIRKKEAAMINQSLLSLRRVITALASNENYVPFRDSNLTRLLQESLGGKSKTCMIATISTAKNCLEETRSTLQYAFSAKSIKNAPVLNQKLTKSAELQEYRNHINTLQEQLAASRSDEGFYVDKQTWEEHLNVVEKITDLENVLVEKDKLIANLQQECDNQIIHLDLSQKKIKQIQIELFQTNESLQELSKQLTISKKLLQEQIDLVLLEENNENDLQNQNRQYIHSINEMSDDMQMLHEKTIKRKQLIAENRNTQENVLLNVQAYIATLQKLIHSLEKISSEHKDSLLNEYSILGSIFDEFKDKLQNATEECIESLISHFQNFVEIYQNIETRCTESFKIHSSYSKETGNEFKELFKDNSQNLKSNLDNIKQYSISLDDTIHESCESNYSNYKDITKVSKELLEDNENITSQIESCTEDYMEIYSSYYEEQLKLLSKARDNYITTMKASKKKFMERMEQIYDRNVEIQKLKFEDAISKFHNSIQQSNEKTKSFNSHCIDISNQIKLKQKEQKNLFDNSISSFKESSNELQNELTKHRESNDKLSDEIKTLLDSSETSSEVKWDEILEESKYNFDKRTKERSEHQKTFKNLLRSCKERIKDNIPNQLEPSLNEFSKQLEQSALPKKIGLSEKKIHEHVQSQIRQLNILQNQISNTRETRPKGYIPSNSTPTKDKEYSFNSDIPTTISHDEIILKRRAGEIVLPEIKTIKKSISSSSVISCELLEQSIQSPEKRKSSSSAVEDSDTENHQPNIPVQNTNTKQKKDISTKKRPRPTNSRSTIVSSQTKRRRIK